MLLLKSTQPEAHDLQVVLPEESQLCYPPAFAFYHCTGSTGGHVKPNKLIVRIHQTKQDNGVEAPVVKVEAPLLSGTPDADVFSVYDTKSMG